MIFLQFPLGRSLYWIFVHHVWLRDICVRAIYLQGMNQKTSYDYIISK